MDTSGFTDHVSAQNVRCHDPRSGDAYFYDADGREQFTVATVRAGAHQRHYIIEHGVVTQRAPSTRMAGSRRHESYRNDITIPADADTDDIAGLLAVQEEDRVASALYDSRGRTIFTIDAYRGVTRNWYD